MAVPTTTTTGPDLATRLDALRVEIDTLTDAAYALSIDADPGTASVAAGHKTLRQFQRDTDDRCHPLVLFVQLSTAAASRPDCCSCLVARALGAAAVVAPLLHPQGQQRPSARRGGQVWCRACRPGAERR